MKKLESARAHLLASPLGIQTDKLLTFAEQGAVTYHRGGPPSFLVSYTAHLIVTDYGGSPADLLFVATQWIEAEVPNAKPDALKFHVDIIDHKRADVSLKIEVTDVVQARQTAAGTHLAGQPDPDALALDMAALIPGLNND